jgi:uncharacterized membrane protein
VRLPYASSQYHHDEGAIVEAKITFLGHPVHQMLIVFPLGLLGASVCFDIAFLVSDAQAMTAVAYWLQVSGLIGAALAIPFGIADYMAIPPHTRAKRIGLLHGSGNAIVSLLFLGSWLLRDPELSPPAAALVLSFCGVGLALVTAWLGGELVDRLGVGVYEDAGLNASNSLKKSVVRRVK